MIQQELEQGCVRVGWDRGHAIGMNEDDEEDLVGSQEFDDDARLRAFFTDERMDSGLWTENISSRHARP